MTIQFDNGFPGSIYFVVVDNRKEFFAAPLPPPAGTASGVFERR